MIISSLTSVLSRSFLNVLDRHLLKEKSDLKEDRDFFVFVYISSVLIPFFYGLILLFFFGRVSDLVDCFFSISCFLLAFAANIVGLSFSYAFRVKEVKHVVLHSKIPELILPVLLFIPFFAHSSIENTLSWKEFIPLIITWVSFIPYFFQEKSKKNIFDKPSFYVVISLLFQMVVSSFFKDNSRSFYEIFILTVAILLWRCVFSSTFFLKNQKNQFANIGNLPTSTNRLIALRGFLALLTQFAFQWAIMEGHPIFVWPILNSTLIVSSLVSQLFLKEKLYRSDWIALIGVFSGSCLPQLI